MSQVFLPTKLFIPNPKSSLVPRPRLLQKLDPLRERKLALVSAPAGFGKTTLLAEWLQRQKRMDPPLPGAWLSLDLNDNDPARFIAYLVTALQNVEPDLGSEVLELLQAGQGIHFNGIWEYLVPSVASAASSFVLVLDDYHVIEDPAIHQGIAFLLEQMPPHMHLVLATRADPPLPLARLRSQDDLVELRVGDLRFSTEETAGFLDLWLGKRLSGADQMELEARTEGWVAGLQLAALAMQGLADKAGGQGNGLSDFVHRLSGSNRFIMDYLVEEVLQGMPEDLRSFLLQTSVLDRLTGSLCDAVTDRNDSQSILDSLDKTNLFLFPLDDERGWYRYHHLFADLLRSFLLHDQPARLPELHARASAWYESQGYMTEAIQHALKIPDPGEAARLMEKMALGMLLHGELSTVQKWSAWVAEEHLRPRPMLCLCFVLAFLVSDQVELAEQFFSVVSEDQIATTTPDLQGPFWLASSMLAYYKGDYEEAIRCASQALDQLPSGLTYLHGALAYSSGRAYEMIGADEAAFQSFQMARDIAHRAGNRTAKLSALKKLGDILARRGQLYQAVYLYRQALQIGTIREDHLLPIAAPTISALGQVLYEMDQLEEAERYLLLGVQLSRKLRIPFALLSNLQILACIHWAQEDQESARRLCSETEQVMLEFPPNPPSAARIAVQQMRMYLRLGETQKAIRWAQSHQSERKPDHAYPMESMAILWARAWIAQENAAYALEALEQALPTARAAGRWGVVIELLVLQALALAFANQIPEALTALEEALKLAEPEGYLRVFIDEGEPMVRLLRVVYRSKEKGSREYETRLLGKLLSLESPAPPVSAEIPASKFADVPVLIDPLTERELEILRMIVEGNSNQEIGDQLYITLGTVKAHVSHIYRKLDVRSRPQAILKADQLQLL